MNQQLLQPQIEKKITKLKELLLSNLVKAQIIYAHDPRTWDSDTLDSIVANLKETLSLLTDPKNYQGEAGLSSLIANYHSETTSKDT